MRATLSVVIIVKNEASRLGATLESVRFADEIIVLDSGSTDGTVELAREYTDKVFVDADWQGFGVQKNRALAHAGGDWVLSLDADECVPDDLCREIEAVLAAPAALVYELPRLSVYCGRPIRHSGWWPDYVARLFRRGAAHFSGDKVHERLVFDGVPARLKVPLLHESYRTIEEVLDKVDRYSTAGAEQMVARGKQSSLMKAVLRGVWAFFRTYVLRAGFLDGREGFVLAVATAEVTYYRYVKLYFRQRRANGG